MLINKVFPRTSAAQAGLQDGDILLSIDGQVLRTQQEFGRAVDGSEGQVKVHIRRPRTGQVFSRDIALERLP